jgi:hypothetical protein
VGKTITQEDAEREADEREVQPDLVDEMGTIDVGEAIEEYWRMHVDGA